MGTGRLSRIFYSTSFLLPFFLSFHTRLHPLLPSFRIHPIVFYYSAPTLFLLYSQILTITSLTAYTSHLPYLAALIYLIPPLAAYQKKLRAFGVHCATKRAGKVGKGGVKDLWYYLVSLSFVVTYINIRLFIYSL